METGINLFCYSDEISIDRQIELMSKNGFSNTFMMSDSAALTDKTADKLKTAKISLAALHAPFAGINSIWAKGADGDRMLDRLTDGVKKCALYDVPTLVVHLSSKYPAPLISDAGNERFAKLMDTAQQLGIRIAYENQRCLANIASVMERFENAGFCWDTGHEGCFTPGREYMPLFGKRLSTVHIHDNFCVYNQDSHLLPYDGKLDFDRIARQIAQSEYNGCIMLEAFRKNSGVYVSVSEDDYYFRAAAGAKRLASAIEGFKA